MTPCCYTWFCGLEKVQVLKNSGPKVDWNDDRTLGEARTRLVVNKAGLDQALKDQVAFCLMLGIVKSNGGPGGLYSGAPKVLYEGETVEDGLYQVHIKQEVGYS